MLGELKKQKKAQQSEEQSEQQSEKPKAKGWTRVGMFDSYSDAVVCRDKYSEQSKETKIRRCGEGGSKFQVKIR